MKLLQTRTERYEQQILRLNYDIVTHFKTVFTRIL